MRSGIAVFSGVVLAVLAAHPAGALAPAAGHRGPDMALVIEGGTGRTTALHSGERDFTRLWDLLTPTYMGTVRVPDAWTAGDFPRVRATVMWGLSGVGGWPQTDSAPGGDVAMGRQDQLFLAADGTPWVRTDPSPDVVDDDIRWHRASRSVYERVVGRGQLLDAAAGAPASKRGVEERARWVLPGLGAGLLLGAGGAFLVRRAAARRDGAGPPREPRQELIDL
ncbi:MULTISPECIES: hypothetical protein [Streptomyces]|uniref:hypothetical protein n=1 Tax=Streptomyces TaxID=1883 RepID=UPI000BCA5938|nr:MULTISPECIES: hypothetical protein [Streptomyces]MCX4436072.1 hypothetical protein [Streptomyces mirabilis]PBC96738.1 hypothetical protein BX281_4739 [Streptomyces sp. Ag82_O1-15]SOE68493.1 hypothetical protein SAMN05446589_3311 [Streptomyces sp. OV198]